MAAARCAVAGETVRLGCREPPPAPRGRIAGRRELPSDLAQLGGGGRRAAPERARRRLVQRGGDARVGAVGGQRQVPRSFLVADDHAGQEGVRIAPPPRRRVLITDRGEQRMGEADPLLVELHDSCRGGLFESVEDARAVAVRGGQGSDRRPPQGRGEQEHLPAGGGQPGQPFADRLTDAAGYAQRPAGSGRRQHELPSDLKREERVAAGHLAQLGQLRAGELQSQIFLEDAEQRPHAERPDRQALRGPGGESALELARARAGRH